MDFSYFSILFIFEVKESISRSFTKLTCSGDLKNLGQFPVLHILEGTTGDVVKDKGYDNLGKLREKCIGKIEKSQKFVRLNHQYPRAPRFSKSSEHA